VGAILPLVVIVAEAQFVQVLVDIGHVYQGKVSVAFGSEVLLDIAIIEDHDTTFARLIPASNLPTCHATWASGLI